MTGIQWTQKTWNPVTGCSKVSPGCTNCYAEAMTKRFPHAFPDGFSVSLYPERLDYPYRWRKPSLVFVNSMSDIFHPEIPFDFVCRIFQAMNDNPKHTFQLLTKRHKHMLDLAPHLKWTPNIWMGVSVEKQAFAHRAYALTNVPARVRFLSCEPLLGPIDIDLNGLHWVIVGGESGTGYRPPHIDWIRTIRDRCVAADIPFFFKQWGGAHAKAGGCLLDGQQWHEMPLA